MPSFRIGRTVPALLAAVPLAACQSPQGAAPIAATPTPSFEAALETCAARFDYPVPENGTEPVLRPADSRGFADCLAAQGHPQQRDLLDRTDACLARLDGPPAGPVGARGLSRAEALAVEACLAEDG